MILFFVSIKKYYNTPIIEKFTGIVLVSKGCDTFQWHILVPQQFGKKYKDLASTFDFIAINLNIGNSTSPTSMVPPRQR